MVDLTSKNLLLTVKEFLVVWIDQILYFNKVYDLNIYDKFKSFNHIVYKNRNPNYNDYVDQLITNIFRNILINKGGLNKLICLIYDQDRQIVFRKYIINFTSIITNINDTITINMLETENEDSSSIISGLDWMEIFTQFSSLLFQHIQELKRLNIDNDNNLFFQILVEAGDNVSLTMENWVRIDKDVNKTEISNPRKLVSIGDVSLQLFNFDVINEYYE